MQVRTNVNQRLIFDEEKFKNIRDIEVGFDNGNFQYLKFKLGEGYDSSNQYYIRQDISVIKEVYLLLEKIITFAADTKPVIDRVLEKNSGRKLRPEDINGGVK